MTVLPGDRPDRTRNFHGKDGKHLFPHPETYLDKQDWSGWDRRYAAHLDRHKELIKNPEPMEGDSEAVTALFMNIEHLEQVIAKEKQLITALRQRAAQAPEHDDKDVADVLERGGIV